MRKTLSRFKGVTRKSDRTDEWDAQICGVGAKNGVRHRRYPTEEGAARAYDEAAVGHVGHLLSRVESPGTASALQRRTDRSKLGSFLSRLRINLEGRLTPSERSTIERARAAVEGYDGDDDEGEDGEDEEEEEDSETDGGRERKKQRSSPPPRSAPAGDAAAKKTETTSVAAVVPLYTDYDCEGSLQLPDDAAFLFDCASDGYLSKRDAKRSDSVGGSFEQRVVVGDDDERAFSVVVHRIPKDDVALAASAPGPATAFLALGGPGWPALSKKLGLAPRRSVRFEVEKDFGSGNGGRGGSRGLVRASRVS